MNKSEARQSSLYKINTAPFFPAADQIALIASQGKLQSLREVVGVKEGDRWVHTQLPLHETHVNA